MVNKYVYQNGKLYFQLENDDLIGVDFYPSKVIKIEGTETKLADKYERLTQYEVECRWHIIYGKEYIFPREVVKEDPVKSEEVVITSDPITKTKGRTRKSVSK